MKNKIIVIKNIIVISILLIAIIFFIWSLMYKKKIREKVIVANAKESKVVEDEIEKLKEYKPKKILPEDIEGFEVIGMLQIPKINLSTYILAKTDEESLKTSVTKLCGPHINEAGNLCIIGHNYNKKTMFGNLKKLEINDIVTLTNMYGQKVEYIVYDIYKINPNEVECLNQETYGNRELTLITCTTGAVKRLVVKLTEVYD